METTVTGMFADAALAHRALKGLVSAGFRNEAIETIDRTTTNRHELIGEETSDATRGAAIGAAVGGIGMAIGGIFMALPPLDLFPLSVLQAALVFGGAGALAGLLIGLLVGSATGHQVQEEYEHRIESGGVLLAINTDNGHSARAQAILAQHGGTMVSTSVHRRHRHHAQHSA